mmetsp:Transcript_56815/g.122852  ORF Transcript_56815/g.122852 Transcript_56815/m.122852 type:complete len:343 (+) Transcript_56815:74-1102(+)
MTRPRAHSDDSDGLSVSSAEIESNDGSEKSSPSHWAGGALRHGVEEIKAQSIDIRAYAKSIGIDVDVNADLLWVVQEALVADLPRNWTEHEDEEGRIYFFNEVTQESSWLHPMDLLYKEVVELVKAVKAERPTASETRFNEAIRGHLELVRERAAEQLKGWSGPYACDSGQYYYYQPQNVSVWDDPVKQWQHELALRSYILHRCLLPDLLLQGSLQETEVRRPLELPLPLGEVPPQASASPRSFYSARSVCSARTASASSTPVRSRSEPNSPAKRPATNASMATEAANACRSAARSRSTSPAVQKLSSRTRSPRGDEDNDTLDFTFGATTNLELPKLPKFGN